jgi:hypothetical protein
MMNFESDLSMCPRFAAATRHSRPDRFLVRDRHRRCNGLRPTRLLLVPVLAVAASLIAPGAVAVGGGLRDQDELWWVSTRHVGCAVADAAPPLHVERLEPERGWREASLDDLLSASGRDAILLVFVHGNRVSGAQSREEGQRVYQELTAGTSDATPVRFVIWSWPSSRVQGQLRDVRAKAQRTELEGYLLGWFLSQLPPTQRLSLLGYSFGARIATGALHLCGGGVLSGRTLPQTPSAPLPTRVVMLAAALPNTWLFPGAYHQCALPQLDHLLNLFNRCDPVLRRYHLLIKHSRATALGFSGMRVAELGNLARKIDQCDVSPSVQKSHELDNYLSDPCLRQRMADVLLWVAVP